MSAYDLEDALRALKDRPSMERELAELRQVVIAQQKELAALRVENTRLRAALSKLAGWRNVVDTAEWNVQHQDRYRHIAECMQEYAHAALADQDKEREGR